MSLQINLNQKLTQSLQLSPQLQQSIKLLQLGRHELIEELKKELLENPVLDLNEDSDPEQETVFPVYRGLEARTAFLDADSNRQFIENTVVAKEGLLEHLLWQLHETDLSNRELEIAYEIIGNLNRDGYLRSSLEEIALRVEATKEEVGKVLSEVQLLEPSGIGARSLPECLLIQLAALGKSESLPAVIVRDFMQQLEARQYQAILDALKIDLAQLSAAISEIRTLEPYPARIFTDDQTIYVVPDVYIVKNDGKWLVGVNADGVPNLELNHGYEEMYQTLDKRSREAKKYLNQHIKNALWLIRSIEQRADTLRRVTESILRFQRDFFESAEITDLKPLILKQVADDIGVHESTVSRATSQKYVNTPHGTFELKYFFSSGFANTNGSQVSSESVKEKIKELIDNENRKKPLSDQRITKLLADQGLDLARRTVAKYREEIGISSSSKRKNLLA